MFFIKIFLIFISVKLIQLNQTSTLNITKTNQTQRQLKSYEFKKLVLRTPGDFKTASLLQKYFVLRDECDFELNKYQSDHVDGQTESKNCPSTADYLLCFPTTEANQTIYFKCPYKEGLSVKDNNENVSRYCKPNGQWDSTNYVFCIKNVISTVHSVDCRVKNKTNDLDCDKPDDLNIFRIITLINFIGFCNTIVFVSLAIFVFLSIRTLRCVRNMIHCNMLFTFLFKSAAHIWFYIFMVTKKSDVSIYNNYLCIILNLVINYSLLCSFFWMMIEAVYLITVIVAAYSSNKIKLWWYLIIGWILPMFPIIPYSILTYQSSNTTCSWVKSEYDPVHEKLIDVPIYILLIINGILLIIILYVIITKLRTNNDAVKTKYTQYKKLIRATLVLFPLFGLTFAFFFWLPSDPKTTGSKIYYIINTFLQATQGVWVAFVYCFLNDEVKNAVKTKLRSWKISYIGSRLWSYGTGSATSSTAHRHLSIPTLYSTQVTNTNTNSNLILNRHKHDANPNDPSRLPILQEDKI